MCTWVIEQTPVSGSAKGPAGWFPLSRANVYFDHPYHAPLDHALIIDFVETAGEVSNRVAVELTADGARRLISSIEAALASGEEAHAESSGGRRETAA